MKKHKNLIDQEIQEALEQHSTSFDHLESSEMLQDVEMYKTLFENLEEEPEIHLGDDFSKTVIEVAQRRKNVREFFSKLALYIFVSLPLIALSILTILVMDQQAFWKIAGSIKDNSLILLFGITLFAAIQVLDKALIKNKIPDTRA